MRQFYAPAAWSSLPGINDHSTLHKAGCVLCALEGSGRVLLKQEVMFSA